MRWFGPSWQECSCRQISILLLQMTAPRYRFFYARSAAEPGSVSRRVPSGWLRCRFYETHWITSCQSCRHQAVHVAMSATDSNGPKGRVHRCRWQRKISHQWLEGVLYPKPFSQGLAQSQFDAIARRHRHLHFWRRRSRTSGWDVLSQCRKWYAMMLPCCQITKKVMTKLARHCFVSPNRFWRLGVIECLQRATGLYSHNWKN